MVVRALFLSVIIVIVTFFVGFNWTTNVDISLGFYVVRNTPLVPVLLFSFIFGFFSFFLLWLSVKREKKWSEKERNLKERLREMEEMARKTDQEISSDD